MIEVRFIEHCDDDEGYHCDLGFAEYICPDCKKDHIDYDNLWWSQHIPIGNLVKIECDVKKCITILRKVKYGEYELANA